MMDIWEFQQRLTNRLLKWAFSSLLIGSLLQLSRKPLFSGLGLQFTVWGAINAVIAIIGSRLTQNRVHTIADPHAHEVTERETRNLLRLLWINSVADIFYLLVGIGVARRKAEPRGMSQGHGFGIIIQGGFLLIFDLLHACLLSKANHSRAQ
jgi:hypothetical protein